MLGKMRFVVLAFLTFQACVGFEVDIGDPRLGDEGHVRFGGGGCAAGSSTALAVGSTQALTLEPQSGVTLPSDLQPGSSAPAVIDVRGGAAPEQIVLEAYEAGATQIELRSEGRVWDHLGFRAEPAASVKFSGVPAVFSGGTAYVKVDEVYGACGGECPLLGQGFLRWSASPAAALAPLRDAGGVAYFTAGAAGEARVEGREPSGGALLVEHPLRVVPVADAGAVQARITIALPDETVLDPQPFPVELPAGSLFLIQLEADAGGLAVPLAGADVTWTVEGDASAVTPYDAGAETPAEGPIFATVEAGLVELVAEIPLLGRTERFALTVTAGP
ncbi:MAG: hypothetical protein JXB32_20050 [Deltaproteobacteria bacterium]|nr:hypothetical protein [Deltaproteobacteria bacterium]